MPARLSGKVALVTGASRRIGKGVALGLGVEGCTVYVTGKTFRNGDSNRPGSVTTTAEEVSKTGLVDGPSLKRFLR
jgi:NAD(P)-dependent dehydrogenase (short-subunit alcohol dehydrogenase family)